MIEQEYDRSIEELLQCLQRSDMFQHHAPAMKRAPARSAQALARKMKAKNKKQFKDSWVIHGVSCMHMAILYTSIYCACLCVQNFN